MKRSVRALCVVFLCFMVCIFPVNTANAQKTENYKLICNKGMLFTDKSSLSAGNAVEVEDARFALCPRSYAVLQSDMGIVNIVESSRIGIKGGILYVEEGIIAVDALNGEINIETGTQRAQIPVGSRLTVRVDDYGNAFNYCTKGSVTLYSKLNDSKMTLNSGEYIAVTVKRGFRILKETSDEDVSLLGVVFVSENELSGINVGSYDAMESIVGNFAQDGDIAGVASNRAYLLTAEEGTAVMAHTLYLECANNDAVLCVYDTKLNLIASSLDEKRANKPNVTVKSESNGGYIVCVYSDNATEYQLKQIRHETTVDMVFNMLKRGILPVCVALVLFAIYGIVETKRKKKPKF